MFICAKVVGSVAGPGARLIIPGSRKPAWPGWGILPATIYPKSRIPSPH